MTSVLFLIRSLEPGGAERQLVELMKGIDKRRFRVCVMTFYPGGALEAELAGCEGVTVTSLAKRGRWRLVGFLVRWVKAVRRSDAAVLHGYMAGANELCLLAGKLFGRRVVFGVRSADVDHFRYGAVRGWVYRVDAVLSRFADRVIVNSRAGLSHAGRFGYSEKRMVVVLNGVDTSHFRPDLEGGRRLREEWGVGIGSSLVGIVGRLDPVKDHELFLRAAAGVLKEEPSARFVAVGDGLPERRAALGREAEDHGLGASVRWEAGRPDLPAVYSALDVLCLSSQSEGFPNVVAEAMACGVPCVVADVGDAAWIVGQTGIVASTRDEAGLADGLLRMLRDPDRKAKGRAARERVEEHFSMTRLVQRTEEELLAVVGRG